MKPRATCPECGKVLVVQALETATWWPSHRRPRGGKCRVGPGDRVRVRDRVHDCKRCRTLPDAAELIGDQRLDLSDAKVRPPTPRPLKARGYCASHLREVEQAERKRGRERRHADRFGLDADDVAQLLAEQDDACACGVVHAHARRAMAVDHDHDREAQCVAAGRHPAGKACPHCVRGLLGQQCNQVVVGRFAAQQLRNLADYIEKPTAQRLGWWNDDMDDDEEMT